MALTRRQFLQRTGAAAAGSFLLPSFFKSPFAQKVLADIIGDRYFVVFFLDGGNDGLNTICPYDDPGGLRTAYAAARRTGPGGLRLLPGELLIPSMPMVDANTGTQMGFHPSLTGLRNLYDLGKLAVIQGCGYPRPDLSHQVSANIWQQASPFATVGTGWMGRYFASCVDMMGQCYQATDIPAVCIGGSVASEFYQTMTSVLALYRLEWFGFPYDEQYYSDVGAKRDAFLALCNQSSASAQALQKYIGDIASATLSSSESYPPLHDLYEADRATWNAAYEAQDTGTARALREVAKIIHGVSTGQPNVHARFFEVRNGGYDTHSDQGGADPLGQHSQLHKEVGDALELFYHDCEDMGVANKLCVMVWSEFGRRIQQNDNGTDHGSQGPMFVIGGTVNGGLYGNHPNIEEAALDDNGNTVYSQDGGNGYRSTDFRDVYGTILNRWLNMPVPTITASILPNDSVPAGGDPNDYWTTPNFAMGFLP